MKALAEQAQTLTSDVLFVADVDMTGEEWTSADWGVAAETSDGGAKLTTIYGNGFAVKGLTAPLFGQLSANVKGLHLESVNINETVNPNVGALARSVVALSGLSPVVTHCSVSGKVTSSCDYTVVEGDTAAKTAIGGLVGSIVGASVTNCSSSATVEMGKVLSSEVETRIVCPCGGIVGAAMPLETMVSSVTNCENSGAVSFVGGTAENPLAATHTMVGGVLGYTPIDNAGCEIANLTNRGAITANGYLASSCFELNMGGVIGYANSVAGVKNCYNYGKVSMPAGSYQLSNCMYIGGVAGALPTCIIDNIHNYGEVSIAKEAKVTGIIVAGVVGKRTSATYANAFTNSSNNAPVSCAAEQYEYVDGANSTYVYYRVAGVLGWNEGALENLVNNTKGVITVNGSMYHAHSTAYCCSVAGGVAVSGATSTGDIGVVNNAAVNINATLKTSETWTAAKARFTVGGAMGHVIPHTDDVMIKRVHNAGNVTVNGSYNSAVNVAGTVGMFGYKANTTIMTGITNSGTLTISKDIIVDDIFYCGGLSARVAVGNNLEPNIVNSGAVVVEGGEFKGTAYIGGAYGWTDKAVKDIHNNGTVTINGATFNGGQFNIAGAIGYVDKAVSKIYNTGNVTLNNCTIAGAPAIAGGIGIVAKKAAISYVENSGAVTLNGIKATNTTSSSCSVGGCVALFTNDYGGGATYYTNTGAITLDKDCSINPQLMVAGCVAKHNKQDGTFTDLTNNAPIKIYADTNSNLYIGGVAGYVYPSATARRLLNDVNGDITINMIKTCSYTESVKIMIAGVAGQLRCHAVPLENRGDIYIGGKIQSTIGVSGVVTQPNNMNRTDLTNSGNITIDAVIDGNCRVGGIEMGGDNSGIKKHWVNNGNITFTKDSWIKGYVEVGGIIGKANSTALQIIEGSATTPSANSGTITFSGKCGDGGVEDNLYIGGLVGNMQTFKQLTGGFTNSGSVIFDGVMDGGTAYVGGLVGNCLADTQATDLEWSGNLVFTGEKLQSTSGYAGGIFGTCVSAIPNAIVYSNINGAGCTGVGMVTGSARTDVVVAKNAKIGGSIALRLDNVENADGSVSYAPVFVTLDESNIHEYIYGGETIWAEGSDYDACSFLSVKPE